MNHSEPQYDVVSSEDSFMHWPANEMEVKKREWPRLRSRRIVPHTEGSLEAAISEWELHEAGWEDFHPHSEVNFIVEGELYVQVDNKVVQARAGDTVRVPAGKLGKYWAPIYARMIAVYGPNPEMIATTDFRYWEIPSDRPVKPHGVPETPSVG